MHRTHSHSYASPGRRLVEFQHHHGIGDGRGGERPQRPVPPPAPPTPPRDAVAIFVRVMLVVIAIAAGIVLLSLWLIWCAGSGDIGLFGRGQ